MVAMWQDNALRAAENLITANPGIDVIYATGEPALVGAIAAVESQGRTADIKVIGLGSDWRSDCRELTLDMLLPSFSRIRLAWALLR